MAIGDRKRARSDRLKALVKCWHTSGGTYDVLTQYPTSTDIPLVHGLELVQELESIWSAIDKLIQRLDQIERILAKK